MASRTATSPEMPGATSSADSPRVTIACASADAKTVEEAAASLRHRGHDVEVVVGVDRDEGLLASAIAARERQGLFVLCRSRVLDRQRVDRLRDVLREHEVPFGRTLTLPIEPGQARALEERIVSVARRMAMGRSEGAASRVAPSLPPPSSPRPVRLASGETAGAPASRGGATTPASVGADEVAAWTDSLVGKVPEHDAGDAHGPRVVPRPTTQTVRAEAIPPEPPASVDESSRDLQAAGIGGGASQGRGTLLVGVGVVVLLLGGGGLALALGGDDDASARSDVTEASQGRGKTLASRTDDASTPSSPEDAPAGDAVDDEARDDAASPEASAPSEGAEDPAVEPERTDADSPAIEIEPSADAPTLEDSAVVLSALRDREVRALDTLLVAQAVSGKVTHAGAQTYCQGLTAGGLTGWRVPSIGELASLGDSKMMKKGLYWSDTPGDAFGDKRMVLNSKKNRIVPVLVTWDGAQAVCVRERS